MQLPLLKSCFIILIFLCFVFFDGFSQISTARKPDYKNFYGISWRGKAHDNLAYARQMKYDYVFYQPGMEKDTLSNGLYFYLESPEYSLYNHTIDTANLSSYTPQEISNFKRRFAQKDASKPFPANLATGWFSTPHTFTPLLDFQQKEVINWAIDSIFNMITKIQIRNPKFKFGGFAWDEPRVSGDFWQGNKPVSMKFWNTRGLEASDKMPGNKHDYATYSDGHIAFYKTLFARARARFKIIHVIIEPSKIYEEWIKPLEGNPNMAAVMPDIISEEQPNTEFVDDLRIFANGLINKSNMCNTSPNIFGEAQNRTIAAKAAVNGALFAWFGRFGGTGDMPNYQSITEVPSRLKLIRVIANWENRNSTPLLNRNWDGNVYQSKSAYASSDIIWAQQPFTNKVFAVFLTGNGQVKIPAGKIVDKIYKADNLFIESNDAAGDFTVSNNVLQLKNQADIGDGFIIKLK